MSNVNDNKALKQWLTNLNCQNHYSKFVDNNITFDLLPELDSAALKELGVDKLGDRLRMEISISSLKNELLGNRISINEVYKMANFDLTHSLANDTSNTDSISNDVLIKTNSETSKSATDKDSSKTVTFILQDGSTKKVNIIGCFNAQSIKRKVLKKLGLKQPETVYDTYIHSFSSIGEGNEPTINLLFDVELVTICYSPDRMEKHRIMLCTKTEYPSDLAISTSKKIGLKFERFDLDATLLLSNQEDLSKYHITDRAIKSTMRNFFGQRPPSELISSNLAEYFPDTTQHDLEATVRNSVRYSVRLSRRFQLPSVSSKVGSNSSIHKRVPSLPSAILNSPSISSVDYSIASSKKSQGRTIGDIMVNNVAAIEEVVNVNDDLSIFSKPPSMSSNINNINDLRSITSGGTRSRLSVAASFSVKSDTKSNRYSRIELMNAESDSDEDDIFAEYSSFNSGDEDRLAHSTLDSILEDGPLNWLKGARIGSGSFGTVYLGMNPLTGELLAVKQVSIPDKNSAYSSLQKSVIEALQHEMTLLKSLNHENIVRYLGSSTDESYLNIFLEYVPGGSVQTMLMSYGPFEEPLIRNFIRQVLIGLSYLHGENIIHRDIKGANILIDIKGTVKISDFGISKKVNGNLDDDKHAKRASLQESVYWMAPEVVKQTAYTKKADIWSVGCLIVEMFTGKHPFPNFSQMQAIFKIGTHITPQIPEWCTAEARDFLKKTFELDYENRPDAIDMLAEPFLNPLIMSKD